MYMNVGDIVKAMYPKEWQELRDRFERDNLVADLKDTGLFFDIRDIKESVKRFIAFKGGK